MKIYIGIDNGVSGSIGIITANTSEFHITPVKKELNYTKAKRWINRIDGVKVKQILGKYCAPPDPDFEAIASPAYAPHLVLIERPMVNPMRFQATVSALRALEATLLCCEELQLPYQYVDSKQWQKVMLPSGLKKEELKKASLEVGRRLFPHLKFKQDADSILMAEWARRASL